MDPKRKFGLELPKGGVMTEDDVVKRKWALQEQKVSFRVSDIPGVGEARVADPDPWHCSRHELFEEAGIWLGPADQTQEAINALRVRPHVWLDDEGWRQKHDLPQRKGWLVIVLDAEDRQEVPLQKGFEMPVWLSFRGTYANGYNYLDHYLRNQDHKRPIWTPEYPQSRDDHANMLLKVNAALDHDSGAVNWVDFEFRRQR